MENKLFVRPEAIVKYLLGMSDELDTLITCEGDRYAFMTSDQNLYEALASIEDKQKISYPKLVKFLEVVEIRSIKDMKNEKRSILTPQRAQEIVALVDKGDTK